MSDFDEMDQAQVDDRDPKLPENGDFLLKTTENFKFSGEYGLAYIIKATVESSSTHPHLVGRVHSIPIGMLNAPQKQTRLRQHGKVRGYVAAVLKIDPKAAQPSPKMTWGVAADTSVHESQPFKGKLFAVKTGPSTKSKSSGNMYIPMTFAQA